MKTVKKEFSKMENIFYILGSNTYGTGVKYWPIYTKHGTVDWVVSLARDKKSAKKIARHLNKQFYLTGFVSYGGVTLTRMADNDNPQS